MAFTDRKPEEVAAVLRDVGFSQDATIGLIAWATLREAYATLQRDGVPPGSEGLAAKMADIVKQDPFAAAGMTVSKTRRVMGLLDMFRQMPPWKRS